MVLFLNSNTNKSGLIIPGANSSQELLLSYNAKDGNFSFAKTDIVDDAGNGLPIRAYLVGCQLFYGNYYDYVRYNFMKIAIVPLAKIPTLEAEVPCVYTLILKSDSKNNVINALRTAPTIKKSPGENTAVFSSKVLEKTTSDGKKVKVKPLDLRFDTPTKTESANLKKYRDELSKEGNIEALTDLLSYNSGYNMVMLDGVNDAAIKAKFDLSMADNNELFTIDDYDNGEVKALPSGRQ